MKLEHFAFNVESPIEMSGWYISNLGLQLVRQADSHPYTTFLADDSGRIMIEIYNNPKEEVPDYKSMNPLIMHIAFVSDDTEEDKRRLLKAGATLISEQSLADGSILIMLKDPWGVPIQLCKRGVPMLLRSEKGNS